MDPKLVRVSRFLSLVLRHRPETIGLELDAEGWASLGELVERAGRSGRELSEDLIREVVAHNDKQRFSLSPDGRRIRANQGHSIEVELGLEPVSPPELLYHGSARRRLASILADGLQRRGRQHVHLSPDARTARRVGERHGPAVVLVVAAGRMEAEGHTFFLSANGVWLTEHVPPGFLRELERSADSAQGRAARRRRS